MINKKRPADIFQQMVTVVTPGGVERFRDILRDARDIQSSHSLTRSFVNDPRAPDFIMALICSNDEMAACCASAALYQPALVIPMCRDKESARKIIRLIGRHSAHEARVMLQQEGVREALEKFGTKSDLQRLVRFAMSGPQAAPRRGSPVQRAIVDMLSANTPSEAEGAVGGIQTLSFADRAKVFMAKGVVANAADLLQGQAMVSMISSLDWEPREAILNLRAVRTALDKNGFRHDLAIMDQGIERARKAAGLLPPEPAPLSSSKAAKALAATLPTTVANSAPQENKL